MDEITDTVVDTVTETASDNTVALLIIGALLGLGVGAGAGWKWRKRKDEKVDDEPKMELVQNIPPKEEES